MREIKYRVNVIGNVLEQANNGSSTTGYRESDIELIYFQLRHCLELIMFSSLVAHYAHGLSLSAKLQSKEYNATKILKFIRSKNPKYYPKPMQPNQVRDVNGTWQTSPLEDGYLTEEEFCSLYDRTCGRMLHAQRKPKFDNNYQELFENAKAYRDKIMLLLNDHWIHITEKYAFRVVMNESKTNDVSINYMEARNTK